MYVYVNKRQLTGEPKQLYDEPKDANKTKLIRAFGWLLIALGLIVPQVQIYSASEGAFQAGDAVVRSFGQLMLPAFIAWFVTRKKLAKAKAIGTLCVGLVFLATSISVAVNKSEAADNGKVFLEKALKIQAENVAKLEKVIERMSAIDMTKVLTLEAVADKTQRTLSKTQVAQFKALLAERRAVVASGITQAELFVSSLTVSEMKRGALEGLENGKRSNKEQFEDLDVVQLSYADSLEALFNWADTQDGKMQFKGGKLLFADDAAVMKFQVLIKNIETQEEMYNNVVEKVAIKQQQLKMRDAEMKREAAKILAK